MRAMAVALLLVAGCASGTITVSPQEAEILRHRFWKVKMTSEGLEKILAFIQEQPQRSIILIHNDGTFEARIGKNAVDSFQANLAVGNIDYHPNTAWIDMTVRQYQPYREDALMDLRLALDRAIFQR